METLADGVWRSMRARYPRAALIAHRGSNLRLVTWIPLALARLAVLLIRRRVSLVLTGDALVNALVAPLTALFRVPRITLVMGLDVTYPNPLYRALVHPRLRGAARVLAISEATARHTRAAGVPAGQVSVIRLGVAPPPELDLSAEQCRTRLRTLIGAEQHDPVLLTVGRLVRRKGVAWFCAQVLPQLSAGTHYVIIGEGPDRGAITDAVAAHGLAGQVHLLGRVEDRLREVAMRGATIFVQPNIVVPGDVEGFGLVTVEAAMRGALVVAAGIEGILDSVVDGETGLLVASGVAGEWRMVLERLLDPPAAPRTAELARRFSTRCAELFSEAAMADALAALLGS
jgi:phosphatidylinositol alpha-1,6-mannosyltransferase